MINSNVIAYYHLYSITSHLWQEVVIKFVMNSLLEIVMLSTINNGSAHAVNTYYYLRKCECLLVPTI